MMMIFPPLAWSVCNDTPMEVIHKLRGQIFLGISWSLLLNKDYFIKCSFGLTSPPQLSTWFMNGPKPNTPRSANFFRNFCGNLLYKIPCMEKNCTGSFGL